MRITTMVRCAAMVLALAAAGSRCGAASVVDQQNTVGSVVFASSDIVNAFGQSFTPTFDAIDFATFSLGVDSAATYQLQLHEGSGYGGALIGISNASAVPVFATSQGTAAVQFDFASPVALTPGQVYSLELVRFSGANSFFFGLRDNAGNPYAGGTYLVSTSGNAVLGADLVFAEGGPEPVTPAVPAPSSLAGGAVGLMFLGVLALRKAQPSA